MKANSTHSKSMSYWKTSSAKSTSGKHNTRYWNWSTKKNTTPKPSKGKSPNNTTRATFSTSVRLSYFRTGINCWTLVVKIICRNWPSIKHIPWGLRFNMERPWMLSGRTWIGSRDNLRPWRKRLALSKISLWKQLPRPKTKPKTDKN